MRYGVLWVTLRSRFALLIVMMIPVFLSVAVTLASTATVAVPVARGVVPEGEKDLYFSSRGYDAGVIEFTQTQWQAVISLLESDRATLVLPVDAIPGAAEGFGDLLVSGRLTEELGESAKGARGTQAQVLSDAKNQGDSYFLTPETPGMAVTGPIPEGISGGRLGATAFDPAKNSIVVIEPRDLPRLLSADSASAVLNHLHIFSELESKEMTGLSSLTALVFAVPRVDEAQRRASQMAFSVITSVVAFAVSVLLTVALAMILRDSLHALNVRAALGTSRISIAAQIFAIVALVWSLPALLSSMPVSIVLPGAPVIELAAGFAFIPAIVIAIGLTIWLTAHGTKTAAQIAAVSG